MYFHYTSEDILFPDCWKVSYEIHVFKKLANTRLKCGLFSCFHYSFRASRVTADLFTVVSEKYLKLLIGL